MRKFIALMLAAVFGLSTGLGSSHVWSRVYTIPYCTVARNPDWYHGKFVRVNARLVFSGEEMMVFENCDPVEAMISHVQLADQNFSAGSVWGALVYVGIKADLKTADAIVSGEFNGRRSNGCWGPKYGITAHDIEFTSAVKGYVPPSPDGSPTCITD